jgi:transposase
MYDEKRKFNRVLSTRLVAKIPKGESNPVPTRPKRANPGVVEAKVGILTASRMRVGMMDIIGHIGKASGIDAAIYASTDLGTAQKIISLARYLLATGGQTLPGILTWQFSHPLPYEHGLSEGVYHELFYNIGRDESLVQNFFASRVRGLSEKDAVAYDSTTISTWSEGQTEARYGFNKAGDGLRTIKYLSLYSINTRQPIAYTKLPGNLPDVVTVKNAIAQMNALGMKTTELVTDNGYYSQQNLSELLLAGFDFLTLVKTCLVWVHGEIDSHWEEFAEITSACPFDASTHGITVMLTRDFQKVRKHGDKTGKKAGDVETFRRRVYLHLFFNHTRQAEDRVAFETELMDIKNLLDSGKQLEELSEAAQKKAGRYLRISRRGGRLSVTFDDKACREANRYHGFFALVANKEKDTFEALSKYRKRNTIEAFFRGGKQTADGLRPRVWDADTLRGRMFVQFVALCYYEYFSEQLRQIRQTLGTTTGDEKHDTKAVLEAEGKLKAWMENTPVYLQLQWFDTVENVKVSSVLASKRWTTEITSRDALYLKMIGVKLTV